ncbi:hypothetical protein PAECIP111893_01387 [Paenibacillus plantiphilus]|uniref:Uncharacterized protein n=1 Tax=Paenibacillus plantiphilus TaxID=2905650 RepID=A0ABM9C1P1_9BACL|nr:hypothetical protein [Paenibacillus plantiphilus]CAH1200463.1 hypothetical protein PAECIP111893_01387 [Paenibacillus plantiphilus]
MKETCHIYVLLTDTGTLFTRLIRMFTKAPLNHASIALDRELKEVYSFGRKNQRNPLIGGFVREDMTSEMFDRATCALYYCSVSKKTYDKIRMHIEEIERNEHRYKYNLLGLFGVLINKRIVRKNAYFCTQFVASILEENGVLVSSKPSDLVTPSDIEQAKALNQVYRGSLQGYMAGQWPPVAHSEPA